VKSIAEGEEETIEEEIEAVGDATLPMPVLSSKIKGVPATAATQNQSGLALETLASRNAKPDPYHTFADE